MRSAHITIIFIFSVKILLGFPGDSVDINGTKNDVVQRIISGNEADTSMAVQLLKSIQEQQLSSLTDSSIILIDKVIDLFKISDPINTVFLKEALLLRAKFFLDRNNLEPCQKDLIEINKLNYVTNIKADYLKTYGTYYLYSGNYLKSFEYYQEALTSSLIENGENSKETSDIYHNLGFVLDYLGRYNKSIQNYQNALDILNKHFNSSYSDRITSMHGLSEAYLGNSNLKDAKNEAIKAISIAEENMSNIPSVVGDCYITVGSVNKIDGNNSLVIPMYDKAIEIYRNIFGANSEREAQTLERKGMFLNSVGRFEEALICYEKTLKIKQKVYAKNHDQVGGVYYNMANTIKNLFDYDKSLIYYRKAGAIFQNRFGRNHPAVALVFNAIGNAYLKKKEYKNALEYFKKALEIRKITLSPTNYYLGLSYESIGTAYYHLNNYQKAIEYFDKNDSNIRANFSSDHYSLGINYFLKALVVSARNQHDKAIEYFNTANQILSKDEDLNLVYLTNSRHELSKLYMSIDSIEQALEINDQILESYRYPTKSSYSQSELFKLISAISLRISTLSKDNSTNAQQEIIALQNNAIILLEDASHKFDNKSYKIQVAEYSLPIIESAFIRSTSLDANQLLSLVERNKLLLLKSQYSRRIINKTLNIEKALIAKEKAINEKVLEIENDKYTLKNDSVITILDEQIFDLNSSLDSVHSLIKINHPRYFDLIFKRDSISIDQLQHRHLNKTKSLIEFFEGDSTIVTFALSKDTFEVKIIPKDFSLNHLVQNLRQGIYQPYQGNNSLSLDSLNTLYNQSAYTLYEKLIQPVQHLLPDQGELIIIPDGVLGYIPFDALLTKPVDAETKIRDYPYLIKDYQISYAYSATLLKEMQEKQHRNKPSKGFLGVAPLFEGELDTTLYASRFIDYSNPRNRLTPLKGNIPEVESLQLITGGDVLIDTAATEAAFLSKASDYRVLHLSTHGKANDKVGDYSFLAFYELKDSLENEWLYNRELYDMELNADMVVLSACETGIGELQRGEGIISLARGFSYAGAKSIITSLWAIDDQESPVLMNSFYNYLDEGMTKDAALRLAKLDYIGTSSKPQPYFWAAFIPIGDMQAISFENPTPWWFWVLVCVFLSVFVPLILKWSAKN